MFFKFSFVLFCCFSLARGKTTKTIDMDYFLSFLRNGNCSTKEGLKRCQVVCRDVPVLCHEGECYCHSDVVDAVSTTGVVATVDLMIAAKPIVPKNDVKINISPQIVSKNDGGVPVVLLVPQELSHPNRRHQIAHFCPNLDVARDCIMKCVQLGKPAFCGKDHRCYCGHKYDNNEKQGASEAQKNFADMYAKYLGNSPREEANYDDYGEDLKKKEMLAKKFKKTTVAPKQSKE